MKCSVLRCVALVTMDAPLTQIKRASLSVNTALRMKLLFLALALLWPSLLLGYSKSYTITQNHVYIINANQSNFVMLFLGNAALSKIANGGDLNTSGMDFTFSSVSDCHTSLYFEEVSHNTTTGAGEWWINIGTASTSVDNVIYMCTGDSGITTSRAECVFGTSHCTNTWTAKGVWHLANGSTLSMWDSVGTETPTNQGATASTGAIDGVAAFSQASAQYIDTGASFNPGGAFTVMAWARYNDVGTTGYENFFGNVQAGTANGFRLTMGGLSYYCSVYNAGVQNYTNPLNSSIVDIWGLYACNFNGTDTVGGYQRTLTGGTNNSFTTNVGAGLGTSTGNFFIGAYPSDTVNSMNGREDEVRIFYSALDANRMNTEFYNVACTEFYGSVGTNCSSSTVPFYTVSGSSPIINATRLHVSGWH